MGLKDKLLNPALPLTFFEVVPPAADKAAALETTLSEVGRVRHLVDAINLPDIRDESRGGTPRKSRHVPRVEPRVMGARIREELGLEVVANRCVVYEPDQAPWFKETYERFGISTLILVGGESSQISYPGPSVLEAAEQVPAAVPMCLGGISIPSRLNEADRIRRKNKVGMAFFTTQVLFDSNDIVWLIQRLNGLEARVFLSFAPVTQCQDLEFLRWLGADIPRDLDRFLLGVHAAEPENAGQGEKGRPAGAAEMCLERSLDLAQRILLDVFDNLPPDPPPLGLNVEHINRRNFAPAVKMLDRLGSLYANLVAARARSTLV